MKELQYNVVRRSMKEILLYNVSQRSFVFSKKIFVNKERQRTPSLFVEVARAYKYSTAVLVQKPNLLPSPWVLKDYVRPVKMMTL